MSKISEIVRELRDNYPAVDVTTAVFPDLAGVACCVIPQDRVLAIISALEGCAGLAAEIEHLSELAKLQGQEISITRERDEALERILLETREVLRTVEGTEPICDAIGSLIEGCGIPVGHMRESQP
jgi:hypothetical protein